MADAIDDFLAGKTGAAPATAAPVSSQPDAVDAYLAGSDARSTRTTDAPDDDKVVWESIKRGAHNALDVPTEALARGYDWLSSKLGYSTTQGPQTTAADTAFKMAYDADPANQGTAASIGRFAGTVLPTLPAAIATGGLASAGTAIAGRAAVGEGTNALLTAAATRAAPLLAGGAAGGATASAQTGDPIGQGAAQGAVLAGGLGLVGAGARAGWNAATGASGGARVANAALADVARTKYDIPIDAVDMTDNSLYRIGADQSSKLPFSGAAKAADVKQAKWQGAIAREIGENDATAFTPDVMERAATRIGSTFDKVAERTSIPPAETGTLATDLDNVVKEAKGVLQPSEIVPLQHQIDGIKTLIAEGDGTISGDAYQRLTNAKSMLSRLERQNSNTADFASDVRDKLDDAFARSAAPEDQAALQQARYQYRVMRTVDQLAAGSKDGNISPDAFMQKVLTASRRYDAPLGGMAYTGGGNPGELARIGKMMRAPPQTGTADRLTVNALALGGTGLPALLNPAYAAGVPLALAANRGASAYLRSGWLANRVIENSLNPPISVAGVPLGAGAYGAVGNALSQR